LTTVDTHISWGFLPLLEIFGKANSLVLKFEPWYTDEPPGEYARISYEENSDTAIAITCLSIKHLGFENMLCDYLIRCNIEREMISRGVYRMRKSEEEMEREWQEHRKKIGLRR
jgi:hypothetical protein